MNIFPCYRRTMLAGMLAAGLCLAGIGAQALFIDPLRFEITAPAASTYNGTITLRSDQPNPVNVEISFSDDIRGAASWVEMEPGIRTLEPRQPTVIPFVVKVPADATGEWRGRIGFSEVTTNASSAPVNIRTRIAVPVYVIVQGTETYDAEIKSIEVKSTHPWSAGIMVENRGNTHIRPKGELLAINQTNEQDIVRLPINSFAYPLFPGTTDELLAKDESTDLPPGDYRLKAVIYLIDQELMYSTEYRTP